MRLGPYIHRFNVLEVTFVRGRHAQYGAAVVNYEREGSGAG